MRSFVFLSLGKILKSAKHTESRESKQNFSVLDWNKNSVSFLTEPTKRRKRTLILFTFILFYSYLNYFVLCFFFIYCSDIVKCQKSMFFVLFVSCLVFEGILMMSRDQYYIKQNGKIP